MTTRDPHDEEVAEIAARMRGRLDALTGPVLPAWDGDLGAGDPARYDAERMTPAEYERRALARRRARAARDARHDRLAAALAIALAAAMVIAGLWLALRAGGPLGSFAA